MADPCWSLPLFEKFGLWTENDSGLISPLQSNKLGLKP